MGLEDVWRQKSDRQLEIAARELSHYTKAAQQVIQAELQRRNIPESSVGTSTRALHPSPEHVRKVKLAEAALDQRIAASSPETAKTNFITQGIALLIILVPLVAVAYVIWLFQIPFYFVLLVLLFAILPGLCKCYGIIVGGFTALSGIKLAFAWQYFAVQPVLPFLIFNAQLSYFCLGWGLLVASRQTRSTFGLLLGAINLFGGVFGLFQFKSSTHIVAPGFLGSLISGLLTIGLGCSTIATILNSWSPSKTAQD